MVHKSSRYFLAQVDVSYEVLILFELPQNNTKENPKRKEMFYRFS